MRLTPRAHALGLASGERMELVESKRRQRDALIDFVRSCPVKVADGNRAIEAINSELSLAGTNLELSPLREAPRRQEIVEAAEVLLKYDGYIRREALLADKFHRLEEVPLGDRFDYASITSLSTEARQKLERIRPLTIGQASRIPGVSPADINILLLLSGR